MPTIDDGKIKVQQSDAITTNDSDPYGGAISSPRVTVEGVVSGLWMPKISAPATGDPGIDDVHQNQLCYVENENDPGTFLYRVGVYAPNLLKLPASNGQITLQSDNAGDVAAFIRAEVAYVNDTNDLVVELVNMNGVTLVGTVGFNSVRCLRVTPVDPVSGLPKASLGNWTIFQDGEQLAVKEIGIPCATHEFQLQFAAALGDLGTLANRTVDPALTYEHPNSIATKVFVRQDENLATLDGGQYCGIFCKETIEPGMKGFLQKPIDLRIHFDEVAP